ncbi:hypothetical protein N5J66_05140 [Pseudomonas juntendi]|jgi:hypothetical protein|uniref:hypothetical protein n=1 Tax=Pseudomonas TaxID=286 RepID=UPI0005B4AAB2|nr:MULTISPECIES: hypothetical protein [Pseudomonas]UQB76478.1 hypothetical protein KI429_00050 [Pseudomonas shirazica]EKT4504579.1 hypothetical protein [Pseudomonas putida]ELL4316930.1 hypothetical protein [Pseudomonas aeruginosa]ELR9620119.1 hypothetical protein [Pseudomonas aeruginosa]MBZ3666379.1 hypothetical protein [Pseudomonas monteilii]
MNTDLIVKRILLTPVAAGFGWIVATMIVIGLKLALPTLLPIAWTERIGPLGAVVGIVIFYWMTWNEGRPDKRG